MGAGVLRKIVGHAPGRKSALVSTLIEAQKADVHAKNNKLGCGPVDVTVPHKNNTTTSSATESQTRQRPEKSLQNLGQHAV